VITYVLEFPVIMINCIFQGSDPTAVLAQWEARMAVALHPPPQTFTPLHNTVTKLTCWPSPTSQKRASMWPRPFA